MIPDPKNPYPSPASTVLDILSIKPGLTAKELHELYSAKHGIKISIQGLYQLITKLIAQRILVKENGKIFIDAGWIENLQAFSSRLQKTYFEMPASQAHLILEEGETRTFTFQSPLEMDNFYSHVLSILVRYNQDTPSKDQDVYAYNAHNWFQLIRSGQEGFLLDSYRKANMNVYHVVGSDSFLDQITLHMFEDSNNFYHRIIGHPKGIHACGYYMSIGDFIIETHLPNYIQTLLDDIFKKTNSLGDFNADKLMMLVSQPGKTIFTLQRNKKKAEQFRRAIRACF